MIEHPKAPLSVIATRLPYIDRRALSQAWFSALHVASDGPVASAPNRRASAGPIVAAHATPQRTSLSDGEASSQGRRIVSRHDDARAACAEVATRRIHDARAAAAARAAFARARSYPPFRSSLALAVGNERVQLLLRRDGATLHVVAVCRAEIAETVRRALAAADAHLRVRGERVRSSVETRPEARA